MHRSIFPNTLSVFSNQFRMLSRAKKAGFLLMTLSIALLSACNGGGTTGGNTNPGVPPVTSTVSGKVADKNGLPISGVTITVYSNNNNTPVTTTTDANGTYSVSGLRTGIYSDYSIYAENAGFGFYPSIGDAAGTVGRNDFNGYYRTVIRFLTMPAHDVPSANFTASRPKDKMASLPRTGQTTSYAGGDDYSAQKGVAWPGTRFTDNSDGTVTDHLSGLVWLKNAGCFSPTAWSTALTAANQLASGVCGLTDGSNAGKWRMPNANELESLVDVSRVNPAVSTGSPFININLTNAYWSSTTYAAGPANAMAIRFTDGRWINGADAGDGSFNNAKATSTNSLWAVKSGAAGTVQLLATGAFAGQGGGSGASFGTGDDASLQIGAAFPSPRFIDNGDGTVADALTGLTWLKQADCTNLNQSWSGALTAINNLASNLCDLKDGSTAGQWRMPNRSEMLSLSDRAPTFPQANYFNGIPGADGITVINPVVFHNFIVSNYYWTSTTSAADTTQAWTVYSCDFGVYNIAKTDIRYSLAVR
jgi:hypothetical protein